MAVARFGAYRRFLDRRLALMLALGFSSGLPLLLVLGTFSARLATSGIDIKAIGLFSYIALPYSLKFIWSPVVDAFDVPFLTRHLGRRRAWMLVAQLSVAAALSIMALSDPTTGLLPLGAAAFMVAFAAATQDVVVDGWRIDAAEVEKQGMMAAAYQLGYRFALISAGAGALFLADRAGWQIAYFTMAALMGVGLIATLLAPVVDRPARPISASGIEPTWSLKRAIAEPLADLYARQGRRLFAILALVALYRMPDFVSGVMANPLYIKLGYSLSEIAAVSKLYGVWIGIAGAFAGGWAIARFGLFPTLVAGAIAGAASNLAFSWLSFFPPEVWRLGVAISVDNFCGSFAGTALIAYMSGLTGAGFAATQYALLSSLYALPGKLVGGVSGFMVAAYGFPVFFALTAAIGIPVVILCLAIGGVTAQPAVAPEPDPTDGLAPAQAG
jgi:PAT family beta-lactamase induction signal transducer AmpG